MEQALDCTAQGINPAHQFGKDNAVSSESTESLESTHYEAAPLTESDTHHVPMELPQMPVNRTPEDMVCLPTPWSSTTPAIQQAENHSNYILNNTADDSPSSTPSNSAVNLAAVDLPVTDIPKTTDTGNEATVPLIQVTASDMHSHSEEQSACLLDAESDSHCNLHDTEGESPVPSNHMTSLVAETQEDGISTQTCATDPGPSQPEGGNDVHDGSQGIHRGRHDDDSQSHVSNNENDYSDHSDHSDNGRNGEPDHMDMQDTNISELAEEVSTLAVETIQDGDPSPHIGNSSSTSNRGPALRYREQEESDTSDESDHTVNDPMPSRRVWEADQSAPDCRRCGRRFTFLLRRHHCRRCGQVVCDRCSNHRIKLPWGDIVVDPSMDSSLYAMIANFPQRVCDVCVRLPVKQVVGSSQALGPTGPLTMGTHMKRSGSSQSLMTECPVCGTGLLGMRKYDQERHLQQCLSSGSPPVRPPRYIVYELSNGSPEMGYECPICFEEFASHDKIARMICLCSYHYHCLANWLERGKGCPVHYDPSISQ